MMWSDFICTLTLFTHVPCIEVQGHRDRYKNGPVRDARAVYSEYLQDLEVRGQDVAAVPRLQQPQHMFQL